MATESDLIRRYRGAFSSDECDEIISHIDFLNKNNLMFHEKESLHNQDHITSNLSHDWALDLPAYSRISELIIQAFAEDQKKEKSNENQSQCLFSMVRFGNVLDSSGSVIPLF